MRVSLTVRVSVRVIQVAILSSNCEATQPRRKNKVRQHLSMRTNRVCIAIVYFVVFQCSSSVSEFQYVIRDSMQRPCMGDRGGLTRI